MQQNDEKEIEVDVDEKETDQEIEVSTEEDDENVVEASEASEDDLEGYSEKVKKRIKNLTYKMRESERREQAAIEYAKGLQKANEELNARSSTLDNAFVTELSGRIETQEAKIQRELQDAINIGNVEAQVKAQSELANLAVEKNQALSAKRELERRQKAPPQQQQTEQNFAQQAPAQTTPDPKARSWAQKNEWFGQDEPMTLTAFSIHRTLIEEEFYDPNSDDYYSELDNRMREAFPHKFKKSAQSRSPVAPASRSSGGVAKKGKIKLSPSQVAIADKLGVSYEQYAKQLARLQS